MGPMGRRDQAITPIGKWMVMRKIAADGIEQILNVSSSQRLTVFIFTFSRKNVTVYRKLSYVLLPFVVIVLDI
jgi:hypothetical protein